MKKQTLQKTTQPKKSEEVRIFNPANRKAWRAWLSKNHKSTEPVRVVIFHKASKTPNLSYADAVEEALCYGWIDNHAIKRDQESMYLRFCPRREGGNWSRVNRERAERMIAEGKMTKAGLVFIDEAKQSGKWDDALEGDTMPDDLEKAFATKKSARKNFEAFTPFAKRFIIQWILGAKQEETRRRRIEKTVEMAAKNLKAVP